MKKVKIVKKSISTNDRLWLTVRGSEGMFISSFLLEVGLKEDFKKLEIGSEISVPEKFLKTPR